MGKTLATLVLATSIILSCLPSVKADWNEKDGVYDVSLTPAGSLQISVEQPNFHTLREAVDFIPPKGYETETVRINAYDGTYSVDEEEPSFTLKNKQLIGKTNPNPEVSLKTGYVIEEPSAGAVIDRTTIVMGDDSILENMILNPNKDADRFYLIINNGVGFGTEGLTKNVIINNNYFEYGNNLPQISLRGSDVDNVEVTNNIFAGGEGIGFSRLYVAGGEPPIQTGEVKLKGNTFYGLKTGFTARGIGGVNLGSLEEAGENIFIKNEFNGEVYDTPSKVPAIYNYWYGTETDITLKTTEEDILKTIKIVEPTVSSIESQTLVQTLIDVLPCYITDPLNPMCYVDTWGLYD